MNKSFILILFIFQISLLSAQPYLVWEDTIQNSIGNLIVVDSASNVFVGYNNNPLGGAGNVMIVKYDSLGNRLWQTNPGFGQSFVYDMLLDDSSNLYVAGDAQIVTNPSLESSAAGCAKIDSTGQLQWTNNYWRINQHTINSGNKLLLDDNLGLLLCGFSCDTINCMNSVSLTARYSPNGQRLWLNHDTLNPKLGFLKFTHDLNGNFYSAGDYRVDSSQNIVNIFKYDSNGNVVWQFIDSSNIHKAIGDIEYFNSCIYVLSRIDSNVISYIKLEKYNSNGQLLTTFIYGDSSFVFDGYYMDLVISPSGIMYITGLIDYVDVNINTDIYVLRVNDTTLEWIRKIDCGMLKQDRPRSAMLDSHENLILTGDGNYITTAIVHSDLMIIKIDSTGALQWMELYNATNSNLTLGNDIAIDKNDNLFVAGTIHYPSGNPHPETVVRKYSMVNWTSSGDFETNITVKVFPNPVSDYLHLYIPEKKENGETHVIISNIFGQYLFDEYFSGPIPPIDVQKFARGVYFLNVKSGQQQTTRRIIVQ